MNMKIIPVLLALVLSGAAPVFAQMEITGIDWQLSRLEGKERAPYVPVSKLRAATTVKFTDNLRAIVTLRNSSKEAAEGLVLRYALSLRLLRDGAVPGDAFWCVPFFVEEVRVSKVGPLSERLARVIRFDLQSQLNKLKGSGFSPVELKLEVMLNPRQGDEPAAIMREALIDIVKP